MNNKENKMPINRVPSSNLETMDHLFKEQLDTKLSHSYAQSVVGEGRPMNEVFDELEKSKISR